MSDKTVKIEYQFTGEDKGLSDKIDKINKSLDDLNKEAADSSKKIKELENEASSLTNTISNSTGKLDTYSDELKEMQKELDKATADVEQLNQALLKQQQIMKSFNTGSSGMVNNQKEVNALAEQTTQKMAQIAQLQNRINAKGIDFKKIPSFKKLENSLSNVNKQLGKANTLSNQLSNNTPVIKAGAVKKSNKEIGNDFKFMRRVELSNLAKENPNSKYSKAKERFDLADRNYGFEKHQVESLQKAIAVYSEPPKQGYTQKEYDDELSRFKKQLDNIMPSYIKAEKERTDAIANAMKTMGYYTEDGYEIDKTATPSIKAENSRRKLPQTTIRPLELKDNPNSGTNIKNATSRFEGHMETVRDYGKYLSKARKENGRIKEKYEALLESETVMNQSLKAVNQLKKQKQEYINAKNAGKKELPYLPTDKEMKEVQSALETNIRNYNDKYDDLFYAAKSDGFKPRYRESSLRRTLNQPSLNTVENNAREVDNLTSKINSKAVELQNALNNNDTALVGKLQGEVKDLLSQRQALEKLQGKTLKNTTGKSYAVKAATVEPNQNVMNNVTSSVKGIQETNYQNATATVNSQLQAQQALIDAKERTLQVEQQIAKQNERTADKQTRNIKAQMKADEQRHDLVVANTKAYEESKEKQRKADLEHNAQKKKDALEHKRLMNEESRNHANQKKADKIHYQSIENDEKLRYHTQKKQIDFEFSKMKGEESRKQANQKREDRDKNNQRKQTKQDIQKLPNNLKNITNAYKKANATIADENVKLEQLQTKLNKMASKGAFKKSDFDKIENQLSAQQKRMVNAGVSVDKANQKAVEALTLSNKRLNALDNMKSGTKTYRVKEGQTVSGKSGNLMHYKAIKANARELQSEMSKLDSTMMTYSKNATSVGTSMLKMQNGLGSFTNIAGLAGSGIKSLGDNISKLGRNMMGAGQNIQQVANAMRGLQVASGVALGTAFNQSLEFNKSLMGVTSTLNRINVDAEGTVSIMSDVEFDANIEKISQTAKDLAKNSIYDANQIMEGFRYTALAGWSSDEMVSALPVFTNLATVARIEGENFANVIDLITDSLASLNLAYEGVDIDGDGVFDEKVRKDASDLGAEVQRLSDVMVKAQSISNLSLEELSESYKKGSSQLVTYGMSLEEITSLYAVLANRGIKGSNAAVGMSSIMANLTAKTGQAKKALDEIQELTGMNVTAWDDDGTYIGIEQHLERLSGAFRKLKEMYGSEYGADNIQLAQLLGGKHHFKSLAKLIEGYDSGEFTNTLNILKNSSGSTEDMSDIVNESSWAKLQIAISQVRGMLLELGDAMIPVVEKIVEGVGKITEAFSGMTDEQKIGIVKLLALLVVLPTIISAIGGVFTILGGITQLFGGFTSGIGSLISGLAQGASVLSLFFTNLSKGGGILAALSTTFPTLATIGNGLVSAFTALAPVILAVVAAFVVFNDEIRAIKDAFAFTMAEAQNFGDFLVKFFQNVGYEINHALMKAFNDGLGNGGFSDMIVGLMENIIKLIGLLPGMGEKAQAMLDKIQYRKENGFLSLADMKAQENGYNTWEDYKQGTVNNKKQQVSQELKTKITTKLNDLSGGKFEKLIGLFDSSNGEETVKMTTEVVAETSNDYRQLIKDIENNENKKIELETNIQLNKEKLHDVNKEIISLKDELKELEVNPQANEDSIAEIKQKIEELTTQRDSLVNLDVDYEGQLEQIDADLTKDRKAKLIIEETIVESGSEEEFEYQNRKNEFKENFGFELNFETEEDIQRTKDLIRKIPGVEKALRAQLEVTTDPNDYNNIVMALEELERDKKTAEVLLEVQKSEKIMEEKQQLIDDLEKENIEIEANINFLTNNGEIKDIDLPPEKKTTVTNYRTQLESNNRTIESANKTIKEEQEKINKKIAEPDGIAWESVNDLWNRMYVSQNEDLATAAGDYTRAMIMKYFGGDFGEVPEGHAGKMLGLPAQSGIRLHEKETQEQTGISFENDKPEYQYTTKNETPITYDNNGVEANTSAIQANTTAVNENNQAVEAQQETVSNTPEMDTSGLENYSETVKTTTEETKQGLEETKTAIEELNGIELSMEKPELIEEEELIDPETMIQHLESIGANVDGLSEKINAMKAALSEISFEVLYESMSSIYETLENVGLKVLEIETTLLNLGSTTLTGITEGLMTGIEEVRIALSTLPASLDTSSFSVIGETLRTSIESARTALMNICGVARNSGIAAMQSMAQALTTELGNARTSLLNVCGVARNSGVGAFSAMGNALTSAIDSAISKVETISGKISSIKTSIASIKMPSIPTIGEVSIGAPASIANNPATMGALRTITNNSISNSIANTSNFSFNLTGYNTGTRQEARNTAKILTTHLKRRGF